MHIGNNQVVFMIKLYIPTVLFGLILAVFFTSCNKEDNYYYDFETADKKYEGTIYEYLKSERGVYDSLLLVLDRVPDLRAKLNNPDSTLSLFAVTNRSFQLAVDALNTTRRLTGKSPLYLEDVGLLDIDSMVNRYVLNEEYDTKMLAPFIDGQVVQSTKYAYRMHIQYRVLDASGFVGGGQQQLIYSDTNNSIFQRYWQGINTSAVNIRTKNGIIHILSSGHDFGFNKFTSKYSSQ